MKKLLLVGLAMLGATCLTGCDMINSLISGEKEYQYDDFKVLLADRKLSFSAKKCSVIVDTEGKKESKEYTYDSEDNTWVYEYEKEVLGEKIKLTDSRTLDVTSYVKTCDVTAAFLNKKVGDVFKFYATGDSYRITGTYKDSDTQAEVEYKFGKDGLMTSSVEKSTDLNEVKSETKKETFNYSDK